MTLIERINFDIQYHEEKIQRCKELLKTVEALEIQDQPGMTSMWLKNEITIEANDQNESGRIIKQILPKVKDHKITKGFNEYAGNLYAECEHNGNKITINYGGSGSCKIKEVVEEVTIPARVEKRKKFVKEGDCDPVFGEDKLTRELNQFFGKQD